MRGVRNAFLALLIGLCTPVLIWVGAGSVLYQSRKKAKLSEKVLSNLACAIDADCPPGFVCVGGYCVPEEG